MSTDKNQQNHEQEPPSSKGTLLLTSFLTQKQGIFLGVAMVVVGSWPGWLPFFFPHETKVYLTSLSDHEKPVVDTVPDIRLSTRLDAVEKRLSVRENTPTLAIDPTLTRVVVEGAGWVSLRHKLNTHQPFDKEIEVLLPLANQEQTHILKELTPFASMGVPTMSDLQDQLELFLQERKDLEEKTPNTSKPSKESTLENLWRRAVDTFKSLVRVNPDMSTAPSDMPLPQSLNLIKQNKLKDVVALWNAYLENNKDKTLPDKLAAWHTHAQARLLIQNLNPQIQSFFVDMEALKTLAQTLNPKESA